MSFPDIPVACLESGMVMLLERVVDETTLDFCVRKIYEDGQKAWVEGFPCPACRIRFDVERPPADVDPRPAGKIVWVPSGKASCRYRPLRGPLFVPR